MSDLLIILVMLGAIIVAGVVVFNWWQEKKFHNRISSDFKPTKRDVLFDDYQSETAQFAKKRAESSSKGIKQEAVRNEFKEKIEPSLNDDYLKSQPKPLNEEPEISQEEWQEKIQESADDTLQNKPVVDEGAVAEVMQEAFVGVEVAEVRIEVAEKEVATFSAKSDDILLPPSLHAQIDLIALLYASSPIAHASILNVGKQFKEFPEHTFAFGLTAANEWIEIGQKKSDISFTQLAYSLQLADRGGPVTRATLNRFQHMVESIGLDISAHVEWQGSGDPLNNAIALDQFCIEVDKTVGFHVLANDGATFHATKLRGLAEAQGLTLGQDGRFHMYNSTDPSLLEFSLKNMDDNPFNTEMLKSAVMHGVTFQLDIPTVKNSANVFDEMITVARAIAKSLDTVIVDDNSKPLGDIHLEKIRQQLKKINAQMIAKGIIPGSSHALRLFS